MPFLVDTQQLNGRTIYHLRDSATGSSASVIPSFGFNLYDLRLPAAGEVRPILATAAGFAEAPSRGSGNGTPVLFPFPNRIRDARYRFEGKSYSLPATNGANAIHGFALEAPWDVVEHKVADDGATIRGRYQISAHSPAAAAMWPTDAILEIRYTLAGRKLTLDATVTNPTDRPLPFGLGFHPYFRLPMAPGGDLAATSVVLPASEMWPLADFLPTGARTPVDARLDFRSGKPMAGLKLDDVLTGLQFEGDRCISRLVDAAKGAEFLLGFDRGFRELVVYTPPGKGDVISLEPYTQTTDAINLQGRGVDAGLRVLGHGEQARFRVTFETRETK